jgi:hypothetical protein
MALKHFGDLGNEAFGMAAPDDFVTRRDDRAVGLQ